MLQILVQNALHSFASCTKRGHLSFTPVIHCAKKFLKLFALSIVTKNLSSRLDL